MEITLAQLIYVIALAVCMAATYTWRKAALTWKQQAKQLEDFIKDPNVAVRDKETEYKNSYEAMVNALDEERRQQHVAMNEVFDVLNDEAQETDDPRLMQCRNILLRAIQISTYGRNNADQK